MPGVIVIGASRGIGLEFVRQYREQGLPVTGTARSDEGLARLQALGARALRLDVADAAGSAALAWPIDGEAFDIAIVNAGVYGPRTTALQVPTSEEFDLVMRTNVLGPMRVLAQLAEALAPGARVALVSSQMGSIALRSNANGWLYRASKTALNSVMRDTATVLAGRATVVALHPGWVRTDMGGAEADLDVATSVADMRRTIGALTPAANGSFLNHDGQPLAW